MKIKIISIVFLLLLTDFALGQVIFRDKKINADSLAALIPSKEGTAKADALNLLARLICWEHMDSSINLSNRAIRLSESLGYAEGQAEGYCSLGDYYFMMDSLGPTMMNYLNALRLYENLPPSKAYAGLLMQFGEINIRQGRPEFAYKYFMQAKGIFTGLADEESMYLYFCLGRAKKDVGEWDSSIYFINKAIADVDPANADYAWDYIVANDVYQAQATESRDTSFRRLGISMLEIPLSWTSIDDNMRMLLYLNISGDYVQFRTDSHRRIAMNYLEMAGRLADSSTEACEHKDQVLRRMARIHYDMGDYEQALGLSMQSLRLTEERLAAYTFNQQNHPLVSLSNKFDHMANKYWVYDCLYKTYSELGDYRQALNYYILTRKTEEEIYQKQQRDLITLMETESKEERTKSRIDLLARDNELKALAIRQSRMMFFGFAAFFIAVVLALLFLWRMNRLKIRNRALVQEQKLLYDLELKKLETEKLVELDRLKSRFFANISHEFRTPLTLIMGPVDKVLAQTDNKDHKKDLGIARKYAGKLQTLINNLLTISRLESGNLQLHAAQTDIVKLVRSYFQAFESLAGKKHISLKFSAAENAINVFLDREKFEQILNNLFSNAIKFTGEGGVIEVTIGRVQPAGSSGQDVEIRVSDTGIGIAPEHLGHVFDRFYQVEHKEKSYYEGTGIGLALTKELVELHHGTINVESEPGKGSCFILHLPLGKDHLAAEEIADERFPETTAPATPVEMPDAWEEPVPAEETVAGANGNQPILLIVEDNADMRAYIREYFESAYSIVEATDGMDGLEKSVEHIPDIIISDVMMPVMDGNEFCSKVKTDERTSHIPVILLTARASAENKMEGLETGADDFISKPFDGKELQVRVKNLVEQRKKLSELLEARIRRSVNASPPDLSGSGIASMDERFLQRVFEKLSENYSESRFGAAEFSSAIGLSISQLNRKIRALTGETTIGLIRAYRLNRASELLRSKSATVAEIAYDVGFSSPSYFTECFRQQFGETPSEFTGNQ